jgi:ubiquinone biosynthesis protein UbiJ
MLNQLLLASADSGINALLRLDPPSLQRIRALSGQVLAVRGREPDFSLFVILHQDGIQLSREWQAPADCTLSATVAELWQLAISHDKAAALYQPSVSIEGNNALLVELSGILQQMNIDWELQLQQWLGPLAAGLIGSHLRQHGQWATANLASLQQRTQDWLAEETRLLVGNNEAQSCFAELDRLKLQLDRLEARTHLIRSRLESDPE